MTQGLFKSFFLHLIILFFFVYGAEIFKENKRFEINEIPLEIVDISDETVNKVENEKKKKAKPKSSKKDLSGFQPPKVKSKPKPPEFAKKIKEKKKTKVDIEKEDQNTKKGLIIFLNLLKKLSLLVRVSYNQLKRKLKKKRNLRKKRKLRVLSWEKTYNF